MSLTFIKLYTTHQNSINNLNLHLFASGLLIHGFVFVAEHFFSFSLPDQSLGYNDSFNVLGLFCQAGVDIASLAVIHGKKPSIFIETIAYMCSRPRCCGRRSC